MVYEGKATGIGGGKKVTKVAVKTLSSSEMEEEFHTEAEIMKDLSESDHIVRLLGLCTKESPFMMLMELMSNGDLKEVCWLSPRTRFAIRLTNIAPLLFHIRCCARTAQRKRRSRVLVGSRWGNLLTM